MTGKMRDAFLTGLGIFLVIIGVIGIFLPILPTTVFLLMAAWCFTKGSPRLNNWLLNHRHLGPPVIEWRAHGVIPSRAKILAIVMMSASLSYLIFFSAIPTYIVLMVGAIMAGAATFILTRPGSPPEMDRPKDSELEGQVSEDLIPEKKCQGQR
ncbi:MAG: YbaN family protein [Parvibaculaceae bacterium]|nr:YbaN family protein [Parvibaculaceae bacterium]